jgi:hypothetical protein
MNYYWLEAGESKQTPTTQDKCLFVSHPFPVPGLTCPFCADTWAEYRTIPVVCPGEFRFSLAKRMGSPLGLSEHNDLVLDITRKAGLPFPVIRPGNCLMPSIFGKPLRSGDFIWSSQASILVSDRLKTLFEREEIKGAYFFVPVLLDSGTESEFKMAVYKQTELLIARASESVPEGWWELVVQSVLNLPEMTLCDFVCKECRRGAAKIPGSRVLSLVAGLDIARLTGRNRILASERLKHLLEREGFTDVICEKNYAHCET